jgi:hypothetical protein
MKSGLNYFFMISIFVVFFLIYFYNYNNNYSAFGQTQIFNDMMNTSVSFDKDKLSPMENQKLNVQVFDAKTNETIPLAYVDLLVRDTNNIATKIFSGLTDEKGNFSYTWKINENAEPSIYTVNLDIIATGYKPLGISKTYIVTK